MPDCPSCHTPLPASGLCGRCVFARLDEMGGEPVRRMGDYELLEELDHGGMGVVWRARHRELGRIVALKMIRGGSAAGESDIVRFRTEAEAVARLEHPGIVPVFELGEVDGVPFFTMPLLTGGSLQRRMSERRTLPAREAVEIVMKIAQAVAHAHGRGVLHRDLKPANVLFDAAGEPHVADFGLARLMESESQLTRTGAMLGTPAYAAPEQIRGDPPTTAGDVFSLGAILYHLLSGRPPWHGQDALAAMRAAADSEPPALRSLNPSLPRDLHTIAARCLDREPARRYASASLLADDLGRWLRGEPVQARAVSTPERLWKWMRRRPAAAALVAVGAVSLALLFIQQVLSERRLRAENAVTQRAEAEARANARELRRSLYAADMALAIRSAVEGNHALARKLLDRQIPSGAEEDLRGFDWQWCRHETRSRAAAVLTGHARRVRAVSFSPDGALLASGGDDGVIRLHKMPGGEFLREFPAASLGLTDASFFADRLKFAARLLKFSNVRAMSIAEMDIAGAQATRASRGGIQTLSFSRDGSLLAAGTSQNTKVWRAADGELLHVFPLGRSMAAFSPVDDRLAIAAGYDTEFGTGEGRVSVWHVADETMMPGEFGKSSIPPQFGANGTMLGTAFKQFGLEVRRVADASLVRHDDLLAGQEIRAHAYDDEGRIFAMATTQPRVVVTRANQTASTTLPCGSAQPRTLDWAPGDVMLAAGCDDSSIRRWNENLVPLPTLRGHDGAVNEVRFSPDAKWLASAGEDGTVRLWDMQEPGSGAAYEGVSFRLLPGPGGRFLSNSNDVACLWKDGKSTELLPPAADRQHLLCWPLGIFDGGSQAAVLASRSPGPREYLNVTGFLELYATATGALTLRMPLGEIRHFRGGALSPDGTRFFTVQRTLPFQSGVNVSLREVPSGKILCEARMEVPLVANATFSPDGRLIALLSGDKFSMLHAANLTEAWQRAESKVIEPVFDAAGMVALGVGANIHLCEAATGKELTVLSGHTGNVEYLAMHPGGQILASAAADRTVRLWHLPTRRELGIIHTDSTLPVTALCFSEDGRQLIAPRQNGSALIFEGRLRDGP